MINLTHEVRADGVDVALEVTPDTDDILACLQQHIGLQKFNAWFKHGTRLTIEDGLVKVAVPNTFVGNWIETHYSGQISQVVLAKTGLSCAVRVVIDPLLTGKLRRSQLDSQADLVDRTAEGRTREAAAPAAACPALRGRLEDFIVGECNKLAYTAALSVLSETPLFNPLFVHGSCGVGKTHLLQGICNLAGRTRRNGQPLRWRYVTGEGFTNDFITALRGKKIDEFRARYRNLDLLAIDDVHFLASKKATQDEFLHTFNAIQSAGRQVVMASDAHPRMVGDLNEQLVSRFMAGMVVKVNAPDHATRMQILRQRAATMKVPVDPAVLDYVAQHIRGSVRELEGALLKLSAVAALQQAPITLETAAGALADHLSRTDSAVTLSDIETAVAAYFGITPADVRSSRRTRTVSVARMICMFLARRHTRMSYPEIGKYMGKNHSSAIQAVQKLQAALDTDQSLEWMSPMGNKTMKASEVVSLLGEQLS